MNVYDFDKTIYPGDSSVEFYFYALCRHPFLLRYAFIQFWGAVLFYLKRIDKTCMKEYFFSFLRGFDATAEIVSFWASRKHRISSWYLAQKSEDDVVISASPDFLLRPVLEEKGIPNLIASLVEVKTGKFMGKNCHGEEKVRRFISEYGQATVERFYSDSYSDAPMAKLAAQAYIVKRGSQHPWNE